MAGPVSLFRLSSIFRWSLLAAVAGTPAAARGTTLESGATPSAAVVVSGTQACPDAAALDAALKGLLPRREEGAGPEEGPDVLQLSPRRDGLDVRLYAPGGALIGEKSLVTCETCDERAQTVAVLVAAWETRWRAGSPGVLPRPRVVAGPEGPRPAPPLPAPAPASLAAPRSALVETLATRDEPSPLRIETRAGLLISIAGGTVAPGLSCDVAFKRRGLPFALAAGVLGVGNHEAPVGPASARWRRAGGTLEVRVAVARPKLALEMHAGAAFTALSISGAALPVTSGATLFDPGLLVGLRGQLRAVAVAPWIEASVALWPNTHVVYLKGAADERDLPAFEVFLGAGVAFGAGP